MPDLFMDDQPESDFALPSDPVEEAAPPAQPRDEQGRFATAQAEEAPVETEAAPVEEAPPAEEAPTDPFLAKYGGDMDKALAAAAEGQSTIGRQAQEIGDLRAQLQEWQTWSQQVQAQQGQPQYASDWDSFIEDNPAAAAQQAYQQGNQYAFVAAIQALNENAPGMGDVLAQNLSLQQQLSHVQQTTQSAVQQAREREGAAAVAALQQKYPDFADMADTMQEIASEYPYELQALASDDPKVMSKAIESLYLKARGLRTDTLAARAQEIARKQTEAELQARDEAAVATATRSHAEPPPSREEQLSAGWWDAEDRLADGWNV